MQAEGAQQRKAGDVEQTEAETKGYVKVPLISQYNFVVLVTLLIHLRRVSGYVSQTLSRPC